MPCQLLEKFLLDNFPASIASIEKQFQNKVRLAVEPAFVVIPAIAIDPAFVGFSQLGPANTRPWRQEPFSHNSLKC